MNALTIIGIIFGCLFLMFAGIRLAQGNKPTTDAEEREEFEHDCMAYDADMAGKGNKHD